ncbi:FAD-dependent oxidoreductase [Shewanella sp. 1_MG-2023]|uniref:NAD(P)/FAD-dependent oxidoreductase n=1 Tax=unclassified Shewanella TaxID=196818 RepID=UPI0026E287F8|nr:MULTISPECIES: FAD-dependent oxidoreductase [unclassified Shewanella]MDO6612312.1 FAD-dependent oxidoreductase [Shewanella sp. 7_MG-2023]MDO6772166.1 FAD-dependent oxidoreductase [Shewanella sp. 2_MG-2023]MDO6794072.1 FAD-dependent oxidoreductase [Shewanella sp. 1_MG-2023]
MSLSEHQTCLIIGASHGGISAAFSLRKEGWLGSIILIDSDPTLPYHRPPLSKAYLTDVNADQPQVLKAKTAYDKANITLMLGEKVTQLDPEKQIALLANGVSLRYNKLIISTGARPFIPPIKGLDTAQNVFALRTAEDVNQIRTRFNHTEQKRVVIIGGGYIGLETAASLNKLGGKISVLERESRLLARVTSPEMSAYFEQLHLNNGVNIQTSKNVQAIKYSNDEQIVCCEDGSNYPADIILIGVGVRVNQELAEQAGIDVDKGLIKGIKVTKTCQTNHDDIYAIGDCAYHHNQYYDRWLRLESVQNAVDQGKVASANICEKDNTYNALPWFWSDQFDVKLQMVGLAAGYDNIVIRKELCERLSKEFSEKLSEQKAAQERFSVWYFKGDRLLAIDAVNHAKAYVLGTKLLKTHSTLNKAQLANSQTDLSIEALTR